MIADLRASGPRRGQSLLEVQVAFALLGIGLAGLCQLVVVQLRQVRAMENRLQGQVVQYSASKGTSTTMLSGQTYYIIPWQNIWARKLTGAAQVVQTTSVPPKIPCDPGPDPAEWGATQVDVISVDAPVDGQDVTVLVDVLASS